MTFRSSSLLMRYGLTKFWDSYLRINYSKNLFVFKNLISGLKQKLSKTYLIIVIYKIYLDTFYCNVLGFNLLVMVYTFFQYLKVKKKLKLLRQNSLSSFFKYLKTKSFNFFKPVSYKYIKHLNLNFFFNLKIKKHYLIFIKKIFNLKFYSLILESYLKIMFKKLPIKIFLKSMFSLFNTHMVLCNKFINRFTYISFFWDLIYIIKFSELLVNSDLLCYFVSCHINDIKKYHRFFLKNLKFLMTKLILLGLWTPKGFFFNVRGKLGGRMRKKRFKYFYGNFSSMTLNRNVTYSFCRSYTKFGVFSIKFFLVI